MNELPRGWTLTSIEGLAGHNGVVTDGDWVESKDQDATGGVRLVQLADVGDGFFVNKSSRFMNMQTAQRLRCTFLERGDLLIARMPDPLGRACIFPGLQGPAVTAVDICIWRPGRDGANADWLMHTINSPSVREALASLAGGTTRQRVSGGNIKRLQVPTPPLAEQRQIVAQIEALFARTRRARADLERIAPLARKYEQAVRDEVLQAGQDAGWPMRTLGEVASEVRNGIAAKPSNDPSGTRILRISAVRQGRVSWDDIRYHQSAADGDTRPYLLRNRDLLFIRFNGNSHLVAACGMVRDLDGDCVYPDKLIRMRLNQSVAMPEFVEMAAGSGVAREQLANHIKTAAGQHGISGSDLKTLRLPMPDIATQASLAAEVRSKGDRRLTIELEAARAVTLLDAFEQSILARAFRGELVPQDPAEIAEPIAPAAVDEDAPVLRRRRTRPVAA